MLTALEGALSSVVAGESLGMVNGFAPVGDLLGDTGTKVILVGETLRSSAFRAASSAAVRKALSRPDWNSSALEADENEAAEASRTCLRDVEARGPEEA